MIGLKPTFIPGLLWLVIATILLTLPGSSFPTDDWLSRIWFDKWVHIGLFAIAVVLWCWALQSKYTERNALVKAFGICAAAWLGYGVGMEFVQRYFIVNRSFDAGDIIADAVGCATGLIFSLRRYIKK